MSNIIEFKDKLNLVKGEEEKPLSKFYKCLKCGNARFNQVFVLTIVTPFENPELQSDTLMPIPVFECTSCKKLVNVLN